MAHEVILPLSFDAMDSFEGTLAEAAVEAERLLAAGNIAKALLVFEVLVAREPNTKAHWIAYGAALGRAGRPLDGIAAVERAAAIDPNDAGVYMALGNLHIIASQPDKAIAAFERYQSIAGSNPSVDYLLVAMKGGCPERPPPAVVQRIYDQWASSYDENRDDAKHPAPALVCGALLASLAPVEPRSLVILDIGCGTGLCAPHLRDAAVALLGIDLSPAMIEAARKRGLYDDLDVADVKAFFEVGRPRELFHAAVASMMLMHLGDPTDVFQGVARALKPGGRFACDFLESAERDLYMIDPRSLTYAQSASFMRRIAKEAGLREMRYERGAFEYRSTGGRVEPGSFFVFSKPAA